MSIFLLGFHSCENAIPDIALENFMYLTLTGAKNSPDIKKLDLANTRDTLFNVSISYGGTNNFHRGVIEATIETDLTLVDPFNADHRTAYLPMPAEAYSFSSNKAVIADGKNASEPLKLTIKMSAMNLSNEYLLPVTVKSVSGSDLPLHEEYRTLYLVFMADIDDEISMEQWVSGDASSAPDGVENVFDGNGNTYWQSDMAALPQWIMVDMVGYKRVDGFILTNGRNLDPDASPKHIRIETSLNKADWQTVVDIDELSPYTGKQLFPIGETVIARYFRVTILSTWNDANFSYLAEVNIYSGGEPDLGIERDIWTLVDFSSEWNNSVYAASNVLNDDLTLQWHTDPFDAAKNGIPQWLIIDMKKEQRISGFFFANRNEELSRSPKRIKFEVGSDGETWTEALVVDDIPQIMSEIMRFSCIPVTARYLKVTVEEVWEPDGAWTYIALISIF